MFVADEEQDIWVANPGRQTLTRLTFEPAGDTYPVWSSDSGRIIFTSQRVGASGLYWQPADGTGIAERLI
ncbi:MAG: PD40 domain-containing protein [Acidobacteria bacterium]|nr:PD40 domain-containing protein [Acidobacteriota bacterium]